MPSLTTTTGSRKTTARCWFVCYCNASLPFGLLFFILGFSKMLLDTDPNGPDFIWKLLFLGIDCFAVFLPRVQTLDGASDGSHPWTWRQRRSDNNIWTYSPGLVRSLRWILKFIATLTTQKKISWLTPSRGALKNTWKNKTLKTCGRVPFEGGHGIKNLWTITSCLQVFQKNSVPASFHILCH